MRYAFSHGDLLGEEDVSDLELDLLFWRGVPHGDQGDICAQVANSNTRTPIDTNGLIPRCTLAPDDPTFNQKGPLTNRWPSPLTLALTLPSPFLKSAKSAESAVSNPKFRLIWVVSTALGHFLPIRPFIFIRNFIKC